MPLNHPALRPTLLYCWLALLSPPGLTQQADPSATDAIVVSATRGEQSAFDLPLSIDSLNRTQLQDGQLQENLSESLARVPGIVARNRQNYAQDLQISSRGFGARASFGVRGLRLYADGIPATMPDGQGQISHVDLGSATRLEVLRGPFSTLYGNSSGGVISVFTEDGAPGMWFAPSFIMGSDGAQRIGAKLSGDNGRLNYVLDVSSFRTDGYREHSAAKRDLLNAKLRWQPDADSTLTLVANAMEMPDTQDPLGLTRARFAADPRQVDAAALRFNTRKDVAQQQTGLTYARKVGAGDTAQVTVYLGARDSTQYQAIPTGPQLAASHPGGVIDLTRDYGGIDAHWRHRGELADAPLTTTLGIAYDRLNETRLGFQNFVGPMLGVKGALRRDEDNRIYNLDQYLQTQWEPAAQWLLMAGVRHSVVRMRSADHYIVAGNGDDSGATDFSATTPVAGITWRITPALNVYASYGRGFETPTLNELAYRADGPGPNLALRAATSDNLELGFKSLLGQATRLDMALFAVDTQREIVVDTSSGGRATYRNAGRTRRTGVESSLQTRWNNGLELAAAYTFLTARYRDTIAGSPILADNFIPGIPRHSLYVEGLWRHAPSGFTAAIELRDVGKVWVNDANADAADAYTTVGFRFGFEQRASGWTLKEFLRVDNLSDRRYAGSVIVNETNKRFFEPAPGRGVLVGISAQYGF